MMHGYHHRDPRENSIPVLEEYPDSGENIVDALAAFLRRLHSDSRFVIVL